MSVKHLKRLKNRGDTIVEVMIVLTILGLAIGIAYATANSSLLDIRQAEEHAQANELAQSQIEALRTLLAPGSPNIFIAGPFCLTPSGSTFAITPNPVSGWPTGCTSGAAPYTIRVSDLSAITPSLPPDVFNIIIQWPDVHGQGNDTVTLNYQLHTTP